MSLIEIVDQNQIKKIHEKLKQDCLEFNKLTVGSKAKAADQLYTENRLLKELGVVAVDTIERMDEEIELKGNKIQVLEKELKDVNHYDEQKILNLLNKNPEVRNNNKEGANDGILSTKG